MDIERAIAASKINWKVVERFRRKFKYCTNEEMLLDWIFDKESIYSRGLKKKPNPFHRHVRINLEKMEHLGLSSVDMVIDQGLKLTKKQIEDYKAGLEETEDEQEDI
jgi:hypothetical protein